MRGDDLLALVRRLHEADREAVARVEPALPSVARAAAAVAERLDGGGRLFYVGAGTSGRLGALDAAELPPTFGTPPELVTALLAGGREAMFRAIEGAEDDEAAAARDLGDVGLGARDAVCALSASGTTPYAMAAARRAREAGALTLCVTCTAGSPLAEEVEIPIVVETGPEVLKGSTRMKAGTAQKLVLNMLSTAVMWRRGLVVRDEMVAVRPTNRKLRLRAVRIASEFLNVPRQVAEELLEESGWELPVALVAGHRGVSAAEARRRIEEARGNVAQALGFL